MVRVDTLDVLKEVQGICNNLSPDDRIANSFRHLLQLMVSAKLGGENWNQMAAKVSSKLAEPADLLASNAGVSAELTQNPAAALECLKTAQWKSPEDEENGNHPSTQDPLYNEFCERFGEKPEDLKSLVLYFTAGTAVKNRYHTLNMTTQDYVGQSPESFAKTVGGIVDFAREKLAENPDAFTESYSNILSSLEFDRSKFDFHSNRNFKHLPCFKPVASKIPKISKLLTIQENLERLNKIEPKVDPSKITVQNQQTLKALNDFYETTKQATFPCTEEINSALHDSAALLDVYTQSKFTPDQYRAHLLKNYTSISQQLVNFSHNPEKLHSIGEKALFSRPKPVDSNIPTKELEAKLSELQTRLNKANALRVGGII